jgi:hypothetical protein
MIQFENNEPLRVEDSSAPKVGDILGVRLVRPLDCYRGTVGTRVNYIVKEVMQDLIKATEIETGPEEPSEEVQKRYVINSSSRGNTCELEKIFSK